MKSKDYMLHKMTLTATGHGEITFSSPGSVAVPVSALFEDEEALTLAALGSFGSILLHELRNENYTIRENNFTPAEDINLYVSIAASSLEMHFNLKNAIRYSASGFQEVLMRKHQYNMMYVPNVRYDYVCRKGEEYSCIAVHFDPGYLDRCRESIPVLGEFLESVAQGKPSIISPSHASATPEIKAIIHNILQCAYTGPLKKMYLETKVNELLLLSLQNMPDSNYKPRIMLRQSDLEKLHEAREYLLQHLDNPCSLKELAHNVGLNDFKLKNGFRQLYGTTVFGLLHEERMQKASLLLRETNMSILEISMLTGYKNPSNFTAAFKKKFGYPPSSMKQP